MYLPLLHSEKGNVGNSLVSIDEAILKANRLGIKAMAITDCSMSSIYEFYLKCIDNNIKPLIGLEVNYYIDDENAVYTLILIAKNKEAYNCLLHLNNYNVINNSSNSKVLSLNTIITNINPDDFIFIAKGINSHVARLILKNYHNTKSFIDFDYDNVASVISKYENTFKDFYLSIEPNIFNEGIILNKIIIKLCEAYDFKYIISADIHYINREDNEIYTRYKILQEDRLKNYYSVYGSYLEINSCKYLMQEEELIQYFYYLYNINIEYAFDNTAYVIKCIKSFELINTDSKIPKVNFINYSAKDYIKTICINKINSLKNNESPFKYIDRFNKELNILSDNGYLDMILIVKEIIDYAVANGIITGPGRGSSCGSLILFLLGITKIDPIKYDLMFERFVSSDRKEKADIDIDISAVNRKKILQHIISKYGYFNCSQIIVYSRRGYKQAFEDSLKLFNIEEAHINKVKYIIEKNLNNFNNDKDNNNYNDRVINILKYSVDLSWYRNKYYEWFDTMIGLINTIKSTSNNASGIIIGGKPLYSYIPITINNKSDKYTYNSFLRSDIEYKYLEKNNFIKFDFLNSKVFDVIDLTCKEENITIRFDDNFFQDEKVWSLIGSRYLLTLFQVSSKLYKDRLYLIKPNNIQDLAKCLALIRTPCIKAKLDNEYIAIVNNQKAIPYYHDLYNSVTNHTNGILLYQEDMIKILNNFKFSLEESYTIMKIASKKDFDKLMSFKEPFMKHAEDLYVNINTANAIWNIIYNCGEYLLNKSHATSYAIITYITAYLKIYHYNAWIKNYIKILYNDNFNNPKVIEILNEYSK